MSGKDPKPSGECTIQIDGRPTICLDVVPSVEPVGSHLAITYMGNASPGFRTIYTSKDVVIEASERAVLNTFEERAKEKEEKKSRILVPETHH